MKTLAHFAKFSGEKPQTRVQKSFGSCFQKRIACLILFIVSGCTVGPNFGPPADAGVATWKDPGATTKPVTPQSDPDPRWWRQFNDPVLTALVDRSIAGNLDLQQAVLRVVEARQGIVTARAAGLPMLNGTASYKREQIGAQGILESQGVYSDLNTLADRLQTTNSAAGGYSQDVGQALGQITQPINLFQYGLDASWELDLFGRVRRSVEQARAQTEAQAEAANDALVMLESEVVQAYVQFRGGQALLAAQRQNLQAAAESLTLTQRRQLDGLDTDLDVEQARTQLLDTERQSPAYDKQIRQAADALCVLTGQTPGSLDTLLAQPGGLPQVPPVVGIGLPSTLARRRPDIREAEAQLHAMTAGVGVAVASFYPDVSLTGNLGITALDASYLTRWVSHTYSVGPSISLPIFQGGRLTGSLRMARAQAAAAALNYRGTVLNALREVEDQLVAYRTDRAAADKLAETVKSAGISLYLARARYVNGLSDFIQVLDAERTLITDRQQLVQTTMSLANDVVALYRALGGGWQDTQPGDPGHVGRSPPPVVPAALDSVAAGTE